MVDDRIRDSVIDRIKKELKIQPSDNYYFVDSVQFKSGPIELPVQGIEVLRNNIEEYLKEQVDSSLIKDESFYSNLLGTAKTVLWITVRNRQKVIALITTIVPFIVFTRRIVGSRL